jgi:hypothetical protein
MRLFSAFPLLLLPMGIYNLLAFSTPIATEGARQCVEAANRAVHPISCVLTSAVTTVHMAGTVIGVTGQAEPVEWAITAGDLLVTLSLLLLFAEVLKATAGRGSIVNHALSLIVFVFGLVEFLLFPAFATSVFFLVLLMSLLDVLGGFIVTIASSRRDISVVT